MTKSNLSHPIKIFEENCNGLLNITQDLFRINYIDSNRVEVLEAKIYMYEECKDLEQGTGNEDGEGYNCCNKKFKSIDRVKSEKLFYYANIVKYAGVYTETTYPKSRSQWTFSGYQVVAFDTLYFQEYMGYCSRHTNDFWLADVVTSNKQ